jgi:site-specific DNA-methyltransferase (adenine-specific)
VQEVRQHNLPLDYVLEGDCLDLLPVLPDESVDLALFSPPYDQVRDYGGDWSLDLPRLGTSLLRVVKDGGICAVVIQDGTKEFAKSLSSFRLAVDWCDEVGWRLFECCIYARDGRPGAWWRKRFRVDHEYILLFLKGERPRYFDSEHLKVPTKFPDAVWHGSQRKSDGSMERVVNAPVHPLKCRGTIWKYATSNSEGNRLKLQHPATYPDKLAEDLVRCFCPPGGVVLDPMAGSGTTCVAAQRYGRRFVGMDISGEYCEIARQRLAQEWVAVL